MTERPILMSAPMVRAILDGRKTMTRRVVLPQPKNGCLLRGPNNYGGWEPYTGRFDVDEDAGERAGQDEWVCPYGQPGDRLWVRETWGTHWTRIARDGDLIYYRADISWSGSKWRWRPSIHMPRWASRLTLELTGVRVERVQAISEQDAMAEGCEREDRETNTLVGARKNFERLWDSLNTKRGNGWSVNPWVWALTFRRVQP